MNKTNNNYNHFTNILSLFFIKKTSSEIIEFHSLKNLVKMKIIKIISSILNIVTKIK